MAEVTNWGYDQSAGWVDLDALEASAAGYGRLSGGTTPPPPVEVSKEDKLALPVVATDPAAYALERLQLISNQMDGLSKQLRVSGAISGSSGALQLDAVFSMIMEIAPQISAADKKASKLVMKISAQFATAASDIYSRLNWTTESAQFATAKAMATAINAKLKLNGGKRPKIPFMYSLTSEAVTRLTNLWEEIITKRVVTKAKKKPKKAVAAPAPAPTPAAAVDSVEALAARFAALRK